MYDSIRPGKKPGDPLVADLRAIRYKNVDITVKIKSFNNEFISIPQRKQRNKIAKLAEFKPTHKSP